MTAALDQYRTDLIREAEAGATLTELTRRHGPRILDALERWGRDDLLDQLRSATCTE